MRIPWRGFYAIVDPAYCSASPVQTAEAILRGGCAALQLRDKNHGDREVLALARAIRARCRDAEVPFVLNDRFDLALLCDADGVHLGQDDLPIEEVRRHFSGVIGVSTHDLAQARAAERAGADLIGFGPVLPTRSKAEPGPVVGFEGLTRCRAEVELPIVAIGGLDATSAARAHAAGAELVAAISAVCGSDDPELAARAFGAGR